MKSIKMRGVAAAVTGALMFGFGLNAMADSTTDIVNTLIAKGVLTEEEGALITKGHDAEVKKNDAAIKKAGKLSISDAIDNAKVYGDIRVRHETRWATNQDNNELTRNRERYKITLGVKTDAGKWYSDLALAMGSEGRSDNATFGGNSSANGQAKKEALFVKRAMVGVKVTDWLALEAGRIANPLYTTPMVWDADLTFDGAAAKMNFKSGDTKYFLTGAAFQYVGDNKDYTLSGTEIKTNEVVVGQAGFETPITEQLKGKAALTFYKYGNNGGDFKTASGTGTSLGANVTGTNNLEILEIPGELSYKISDSMSAKLYGDYVVNLDADKRAQLAADTTSAANDDSAWTLGVSLKSQADKKKYAKGDWQAKVWYQQSGLYALDPNAVDSDFFDSKINTEGTVFKAEYMVEDNVVANFAYGHGSRYNNDRAAAGVSGDTGFNFKDFDLLQADLTYKF